MGYGGEAGVIVGAGRGVLGKGEGVRVRVDEGGGGRGLTR